MLTISGFHKFAEEDNYDHGCIGQSSCTDIDYRMTSATIDNLLAQIANFVGCELKDLELNSCDEDGRVDCSVTENGDGYPATKQELTQWREGKIKLYYAVYSCHVTESTPFRIPTVKGDLK